ncbi:MAG: cell wall metabolism sensor histidine kinase WalK [Candidatus Omnitrophica bacterium]|nr:cell wall metabolism sensor histidine kinase WalK [Candidatus Omnitrophota bacterium]
MKNRIVWKFLGAYTILILVGVFVLNFFVSLKLRDYYEQKITDKLESNAILAADILKGALIADNRSIIERTAKDLANKLSARVTIINEVGEVLGDSEKAPSLMENHSDRPEIIKALRGKFGESIRFSDTLGFNMKYIAASIKENGNIIGTVRLALPLSEIEFQLRVIHRIVLFGALVAIVVAFLVGYFISKSITMPIREMTDTAEKIAQGDFSKKVKVKSKDELGVLASSLNKMADELQLKIENLKRLDRIRTDFVANISHELKTPLTSIKGFIETLEDGALEDRKNAKKFILIIKKHTEKISNIINDLLTLSELELGKDRIERIDFDLKDLLNETLLGFGHAISVKNHTLDINFKGENFKIKADKDKLEQVFVNLIDNAIKYTKDGGKIKISLIEQKEQISIEVVDNGVGIPREHLDRIFERFYRVDKARSRQLGGTGLGLSIVKHIIMLHNGHIDIESEPNHGTKVSITLPKA